MQKEKILIYGAGGFGREIACLINAININERRWDFIGFIDDGMPAGSKNDFGTVLGNIDFLNSYPNEVAVAISVASPKSLKWITESVTNNKVWYPNLIAPDTKFHDEASLQMGMGNILFFSSRISCNVSVGDFNIINSLASLGHDARLGDRNVLNPQVRISGNCIIGNDNFFGMNSIVLQGLKIGNNTRVGVSAVVLRNTVDGHSYFGNPARRIRS